jgi:hypothetical protein
MSAPNNIGGELLLYPIEKRTTIATNQKKQIEFLDVPSVHAERVYEFYCSGLCDGPRSRSVVSVLKFRTSGTGGLGAAMPAGVARIYMRDSAGKARFVGESKVEHTAKGEDVMIATGFAFDVKAAAIKMKRERISTEEWVSSGKYRIYKRGDEDSSTTFVAETKKEFWRTEMRFRVTNARYQPVTVEIKQNGLEGLTEETRILAESISGTQYGIDERRWKVEVPARGMATLDVTYLTTF